MRPRGMDVTSQCTPRARPNRDSVVSVELAVVVVAPAAATRERHRVRSLTRGAKSVRLFPAWYEACGCALAARYEVCGCALAARGVRELTTLQPRR
jgi:hypothetical protein